MTSCDIAFLYCGVSTVFCVMLAGVAWANYREWWKREVEFERREFERRERQRLTMDEYFNRKYL